MRAIGYQLTLHLRDHKIQYLVTFFLLLVGLSCGSATASRLPLETSAGWGSALGGTLVAGQGGAFGRALWREVRFFGLVALCGIGLAGIPASALLVAIRGFIVGFTGGFLLVNYGSGGFFVLLIAVAPQNLLILPAVLAAATSAVRAPLTKAWGKRYWMTWLIAFGMAIAGAGVEALLSGLLPKMV
jgi:stage II sporulation protein M